jgi:Biotin-lipoyl like
MKNLFAAIILSFSLIFGASCSKKSGNANTIAPEVLATEVARKDVPIVQEWVATLDGLVNATISARVSGHLISQDYKEGTAVKKGDPLFQIDPRPFEDALAQAKATLAKDEAARIKAEQDEKRAVVAPKAFCIYNIRTTGDHRAAHGSSHGIRDKVFGLCRVGVLAGDLSDEPATLAEEVARVGGLDTGSFVRPRHRANDNVARC